MPVLTRLLGVATAAYGAAIVAEPKFLARPCGLADAHGNVAPAVRTMVGGIGARDLAIGAAMVFAPAGTPTRVAVAARVASDLADALVFGLTLPDRAARPKVAAFAVTWAVACAVSAFGKK
ncbi:hypothetical protein ABZ816_24495 [Actinosynnema sp. NPDC047251]|uniref:Uncharacterized protein n=1 Tax=Saccharothrix espanaensis (strain ATCC 51144 / DSM 44229 / JCM 9112 / NBRC 15066 / NRRL 15764) TaxID=1179773 RepID=K0K435_SACES|nr:hypothetical protein [Saccharothrix espanaensis]CCH32362.1 hypothetical protein BN6_50960 [Saccharothrix espanaensis DSM 44229]